MKKITLILALLTVNTILSQKDTKFVTELGIGTQQLSEGGTDAVSRLGGDLTASYFTNKKFGIFARAGFDRIKSAHVECDYSYLYKNLHIGAVTNTSAILGFHSFTSKFAILNRFGAGISSFGNSSFPTQNNFSLSIGTVLKYDVSDKLFIKLEHSRIGNIGQNYTLDRANRINSYGVDSFVDQFRIGVGFNIFGTSKRNNLQVDKWAKPAEVKRITPKLKSIILQKKEDLNEYIFFDEGSYKLNNRGLNATKKIIDYLKEHSQVKGVFVGYACTTHGSDKKNLELSRLRAKEVRDKVVSSGIESNRLSYIGLGKDPVFVGKENSDLAKRVEFKIK